MKMLFIIVLYYYSGVPSSMVSGSGAACQLRLRPYVQFKRVFCYCGILGSLVLASCGPCVLL